MKRGPHRKGCRAKDKSVRKIKIRRFWTINPRTRIKKSAKIYSRNRLKKELKKIIERY